MEQHPSFAGPETKIKRLFQHCRLLGQACLFSACVAVILGLLVDALYLGLTFVFLEPVDWEHIWFLQQAALATMPANLCILLVSQYVASRER